ncbi:MAG: APC family permease [Clostridium sp.]|uniref:APC family permease n=1 Tax=Clostridium sp. TaxID=1506 RepID=UPI002A8DCAF2|nr:APC family permease [Clostridium sp.]MDY5098842.1 APC family permease [Clostridium sp.]
MGDNLKKELKLSHIIAMAAGGMIAAWMVEIKYWFEISGPGALFSLLTCCILVLPLCLIYSEMTSTLPYAGGENVWISNAFGWNTGWFSCWALILLYIVAMPSVAFGISSMLSYLFPVSFLQLKMIAAAIICIWFFLTNMEIKFLARIQNIMFWSTLVVSICASIIFITSDQWHYSNLTPWFPSGFEGFSLGVGLLIMKFQGFDLIPQLAEESNFPRKKLLIAFISSMLLTLLIYGLAIVAVGGIVSNEWMAQTDVVDPRVADMLGMHWLAIVIVVMGIITCITTLSGFWLSASRTLYGGAKQGQFSKVFTAINKNGQPWKANLVIGIFSLYFTVFAPEAWINYIFTITGLSAGVIYLGVSLSFLRLRKTKPHWERPFKVKCGNVMGCISTVFCTWVIYTCTKSMDVGGWIAVGLYFALGIPFWLYAKKMQIKKPNEWKKIILSPDNVCEYSDELK